MTVNLITVGKLKERYLREGCAEYEKRLSAYCKLHVIEVAEEKCADTPSPSQIRQVLEKEGQRLLSKIPERAYVAALCIEGRLCSSQELARQIGALGLSGCSCLCLVIGGSFGLSDAVKQRAQLCLSMSPMTFPHQLARMMLLEQLYRAFSLNRNGKYHK